MYLWNDERKMEKIKISYLKSKVKSFIEQEPKERLSYLAAS